MSRTWEALKRAEAERTHLLRPVERPVPSAAPAASPAAPHPAHLEYERIRVWLRHPTDPQRRLQTVMVVACHSGAGGTTTAGLLAATLAETRSSRVLIVESNWRTPGLGNMFRVPKGPASTGLPIDADALEARILPTDRPNLFVLPAPSSEDPSRRPFDDDVLDEFLAVAKQRFDLVVFDAAPVNAFPDAFALAPRVDGVILVTQSEKTRIDDAQRAKHDLERAGGRIVGVVVNRHTDYVPRLLRRAFGSR